jgi:hypothetical protein
MSFANTCLSWNDITAEHIIILLFVMVLIYLYIFHFLILPIAKPINDFHDNTCIIPCTHGACQTLTKSLRDSNYLLGSTFQPAECIFTMWELLHMIFNAIIGYIFNIYIALAISVLFEVFEHYTYNCASILDLFWNTIGIIIGVSLRHLKVPSIS